MNKIKLEKLRNLVWADLSSRKEHVKAQAQHVTGLRGSKGGPTDPRGNPSATVAEGKETEGKERNPAQVSSRGMEKMEELQQFILSYMSTTKIWNTYSNRVLGYDNDEEKQQGGRIPSLYRSKMIDEGGGIYAEAYKLRMPFRWIPNCSRFEIKVGGLDWLFALFGKHKRTEGEVQIRNWRNIESNRFLFYRFRELGELRDSNQQEAYWKSGWRLMRSRAYQVSALNYVMSGWYKDRSLSQVLKVLQKVERLVEDRSTDLQFHRTYIPKADPNKVRPLGVPTLEWRIYLHMLNNLIVWSRTGKEGRQHAYFPQRGVITAWEEVMKLKDADNIYEFDLTGFFDNVDLKNLESWMKEELNMPEAQAEWFMKLNQAVPKLTEEDKIEEKDRGVMFLPTGAVSPTQTASNTQWYNFMAKSLGLELNEETMKVLSGMELTHLSLSSPEGSPQPSKVSILKKEGVPQGAATSCGLSTIPLSSVTNRTLKSGTVSMYADDGLLFSPNQETEEIRAKFEEVGSPINEAKSGWVKKDGKWIKPLKYLGLEYDGSRDSFTANTRSGNRKEFTTKDQFLSFLADWRSKISYGGSAGNLNNWERLPYTWGDWTQKGLKEFGMLKEYSTLLFGTYKGYFVNQLYNESKREGDQTLHLSHSQCWIIREWPYYKWKLLQSSATVNNLVQYELSKLGLGIEKEITPLRRGTNLHELKANLEEIKTEFRGLRNLVQKISSLSRSLNLMEDTQHLQCDVSSHRLRLGPKDWRALSELLPLTLHNASTYACDVLLNRDLNQKWASTLRNRWGEEIKLKMYLSREWSLHKDRAALASYLEENAPKRTRRRTREKNREFKREIGAKLLS